MCVCVLEFILAFGGVELQRTDPVRKLGQGGPKPLPMELRRQTCVPRIGIGKDVVGRSPQTDGHQNLFAHHRNVSQP